MNNTKAIPLLLTILLTSISSIALNPNITITGKIDIAENGDLVHLNKPVSGYFNIFYSDPQDDAIITNNTFNKGVMTNTNAFIRLQSRGLPKFVCYIDTAPSINFEVTTHPGTKKQTVRFTGLNAMGNNLFTNRKLLNKGGEDQIKVVKIIQKETTAIATQKQLLALLHHYTDTLKSLKSNNKITSNCFNALTAETEQRLLFWCMGVISEGFNNPTSVKMNNRELVTLCRYLFSEFDPFKEKYAITTTVANTAQYKCRLIHENKLQLARDENPVFWKYYAKQFALLDGDFAMYDYAPDKQQQFLIGNALLTATVFKPMSDQEFLKVFKTYHQHFPNSPYNVLITAKLLNIVLEQKTPQSTTTNKFIYLDPLGNITKYSTDNSSSIGDLIKKKFPNQAVFVDFWATYCAPCIAEFKHEKHLNQFLEKNKIALLYISLDNSSSEKNWLNFIKTNKLHGYHLLTNKAEKESLEKQFSGIPHYMLYNKQGKLVEKNASRPSSGDQLFTQIERRLQTQ